MKKFAKRFLIGTTSATLLLASVPPLTPTHSPVAASFSAEAATPASVFLREAQDLPNVSFLHQMIHGATGLMNFDATKADILHTRSLYNQLSPEEQNHSEVQRWEGYLTVKETVVGISFVNAIQALPNVSELRQMPEQELAPVIDEMARIRRSYSQLSAAAKADHDVVRWAGYLAQKEKAVQDSGTYFVESARSLPRVADISEMAFSLFLQTKADIQAVRTTYNRLADPVKNNAEVMRWEGFLTEKEAAVGLSFVQQVRALPSVAAIHQMDETQKAALALELDAASASYNGLAPNAQTEMEVARWYHYLNQKQAALVLSDAQIQTRTAQINHQWAALKPVNGRVEFVEQPSTQPPYILGQLTQTTLTEALNVTNFIRYVAGLPADLQLNEAFNKEAQAASVVNAANRLLTHHPKKPAEMEEAMYQLGYKGASTSNIAMGYSSIIQSIASGYMEDGDANNIASVGHRLWILSPTLKEVGFGYANRYSAMKVYGGKQAASYVDYDFVSWPAETAMPLSNRGKNITFWNGVYPWSVSLNPAKYDNQATQNVQVELVRLNDKQTWTFNAQASDGYFNISTGAYGNLPYTIIFRPDAVSYKPGDRFQVNITGLKTKTGAETSIRFETTFFELAH